MTIEERLERGERTRIPVFIQKFTEQHSQRYGTTGARWYAVNSVSWKHRTFSEGRRFASVYMRGDAEYSCDLERGAMWKVNPYAVYTFEGDVDKDWVYLDTHRHLYGEFRNGALYRHGERADFELPEVGNFVFGVLYDNKGLPFTGKALGGRTFVAGLAQ